MPKPHSPSSDDRHGQRVPSKPVVEVTAHAARSTRRVIIAGYGPVGRAVAQQLDHDGVNVKVIELNLSTIERQLDLDKSIIYGDVSDPNILKQAGIHNAEAIVVTIPDAQAAIHACRVARALAPKIIIAVRVNHLSEGLKAKQAGADEIIVEEWVTAQAMQEAVCDRLKRLDDSSAT